MQYIYFINENQYFKLRYFPYYLKKLKALKSKLCFYLKLLKLLLHLPVMPSKIMQTMKNPNPQFEIDALRQENEALKKELEILNKADVKPDCKDYQKLFMSLSVGILIFDEDFIIREANNKMCEIFQVDRNFIIGKGINKMEENKVMAAFRKTKNGVSGFYEGEYITKSGLKTYISAEINPYIFSENGRQIKGGIATIIDITDNKMAENAVNKSFATFQTVLMNLKTAVYCVDAHTHEVLFMNTKSLEIFGNQTGKECWKALYPKKIKICAKCSLSIFSNKNKTKDTFLKRKDIWLSHSDTYIEWIDGRQAILVTAENITETKRARSVIENQNKQLEQSLSTSIEQYQKINLLAKQLKEDAETKDRIFSIIGHDLRGPMGNIKNLLDLVITDFDNFSKQQIFGFIDPIRHSAGTAYILLENLLHWAKSQIGIIKFEPEAIALSDVIEETVSLISAAANSKNITLDFEDENDFIIYADENMINAIFRNLAGNAVKFTPSGGKVSISTKKVINKGIVNVEITVKDTGIGISKENIKKMFDKEQYFTTYGTKNEKGSGLGMILCKEFTERHSGSIKVQSTENKGSVFTISLPEKKHKAIL